MKHICCLFSLALLCVACARRVDATAIIQVDVTAPQEIAVNEESQKRVELESTPESLIKNLRGLFVYDSLYIVYTDNRLLRFSGDGRFLGGIGAQGRSGDEYIGIWSAWQTEDGVSLYDMNGKKLMAFDENGTLISTVSLTASASDNPFQKICPLTDRYNVGMCMYKGEEDFELALYDETYSFVRTVGDMKLNDGLSLGYPFSRYENGVLYWRFLENNIYHIDSEGNVVKRYQVDFGPHGIPSAKSFSDNYDRISYLNSHKSMAGMIADVKETDRHMAFTYLWDGMKYFCLTDKPDDSVACFRFVNKGFPEAVFLNAYLLNDSCLLIAFEESDKVVLYELPCRRKDLACLTLK